MNIGGGVIESPIEAQLNEVDAGLGVSYEEMRQRLENQESQPEDAYLNFRGARVVDYRSAFEMALLVAGLIGVAIAVSMGAEWWAYLVIVAVLLFMVWLITSRI